VDLREDEWSVLNTSGKESKREDRENTSTAMYWVSTMARSLTVFITSLSKSPANSTVGPFPMWEN
jgi:hypothetical protein